jgi:uncharacterized protein YyaL (SSP411 family)
VYDGAIPSGNSVMAYNLLHLSILVDKNEWRQRSLNMITSLGHAIIRYPTSFGNWACLLQEIIAGTIELAVVGQNATSIFSELLKEYIPLWVFISSSEPDPAFPLLADKPARETPAIYLCRNYTCHHPVFSVKELISLINSAHGG